MESSPELLLKDAAFTFQKHGHNLTSALLYAEVAQDLKNDASVWTGMGAALARSTEELGTETAYTWSAKSLKRGLEVGAGTPFVSPCRNWLEVINDEMDVSPIEPLRDGEISDLSALMQEEDASLKASLNQLPPDAQAKVLEAVARSGKPRFAALLATVIGGEHGAENGKLALREIPRYGDHPAIREALAKLAVDPSASEHQPELGMALKSIDPEWAAQFGEF